MKLLLHICCAPCGVKCIETLREEGISPTGFFYNPNVLPQGELDSRLQTLKQYAKDIELPLIIKSEFVDENLLQQAIQEYNLTKDYPIRCEACYRLRLEMTAMVAKELGYDAFTSTLFISPYQSHELMRRIATEAAAKFGIEFLYRDFRPFFREGQKFAREQGFYMQKYCGCLLSRDERDEQIARKNENKKIVKKSENEKVLIKDKGTNL